MSEQTSETLTPATPVALVKRQFHAAPLVSTLVSAVVVLAGIFAVYTLIRDAKKDHMELVAALSKNNQEVTLLKVIDDRVKAPMETKVAMARTIINLTTLKRMDIALVCGVIDVETGGTWKTDQISPVGAVGIMQVMPGTGKPHLRAERIDPTQKALIDPVNNLICGIITLADYRDQTRDLGLDKEGSELTTQNFGVTLACYNQGPRARSASPYSAAVLSAAKKFQALGL